MNPLGRSRNRYVFWATTSLLFGVVLLSSACSERWIELTVTAAPGADICLSVHSNGKVLSDQRFNAAQLRPDSTITLLAGSETADAVDVTLRQLAGTRATGMDRAGERFDNQRVRLSPRACEPTILTGRLSTTALGTLGRDLGTIADARLIDLDGDGRQELRVAGETSARIFNLERGLDANETETAPEGRVIGSGFLTCVETPVISAGDTTAVLGASVDVKSNTALPSALLRDPSFLLAGASGVFLLNTRTAAAPTLIAEGNFLHLAAADLTGDGLEDLVGVGPDGAAFFLNLSGTFVREDRALPRFSGRLGAIASGDLNGDRVPDLAIASSDGTLLIFNRGDGFLELRATLSTSALPDQLFIEDVTGDCRDDLVVVAAGEVTVFEFTTEVAGVGIVVANDASFLLVGDVDGDKVAEAVIVGTDGGVSRTGTGSR